RKKREVGVQFVQETPGGYISSLEVKNFGTVTHHRVVVGKDHIEDLTEKSGKEIPVDLFMKYVVKFMMDKGMKFDNTEGMIDASVFPINYFTVKQVCMLHRWPECFSCELEIFL
ncbi:unnamed protein product, partial [Discosporangium mesarthrocarpum]